MEYDLTVNEIVSKLFTKPPLPPGSFCLRLQHPNPNNTVESNIFHFLMQILIEGAKILYGNEIKPTNISETQFNTLKQYILSLGYELKHEYTYIDEQKTTPYSINIWFEPYQPFITCNGIIKN
jgi:hypothetical protein